MSVRNSSAVKAQRRIVRDFRKTRWHEAYNGARFIAVWCCLHSGRAFRPNRALRRGNLTHGKHGQFNHPMTGRDPFRARPNKTAPQVGEAGPELVAVPAGSTLEPVTDAT